MSFWRNGKTRYCKGCGEKIPAKGKKKNALYCSQDCMGKAMRTVPVRHCEQCHKPMVSTWKAPVSRERRFCSQSCYFGFKGETSIERTVREWLAEAHIQAKPQYMFGRYTVDFFVPDFQLAIECDGNYWHTTMEKSLTKRMARNALLVEFGVRQVRLTQAQIQSGEFKKILSEVMTNADSQATERQVSDTASV
jgi:very-short-patch-repair endonuclease